MVGTEFQRDDDIDVTGFHVLLLEFVIRFLPPYETQEVPNVERKYLVEEK